MIDPLIIAGVVFLASVFGARYINENAYKLLSQDQKAGLIDALSPIRKKTLMAVLVIVILFLVLSFYSGLDTSKLFFIYFGLLIALMIVTTMITKKTLGEEGFPSTYIKQYMLSTAVRYFGVGVFLIVLLMDQNISL